MTQPVCAKYHKYHMREQGLDTGVLDCREGTVDRAPAGWRRPSCEADHVLSLTRQDECGGQLYSLPPPPSHIFF